MTEIDSSPLVLHGRRRSAARLRSGVLLRGQGGVRRRTPVAAIERVEVRGRRGREFAVVLTSNDPRPVAPGHSLVSRSAPAVREFTEALRRALPVRYVAEPRPDGASLVARGAGEQAVVSVGVPTVLAPGVAALVGGARYARDAAVLRARRVAVEGSRSTPGVLVRDRLRRGHGQAPRLSYVDAHGESGGNWPAACSSRCCPACPCPSSASAWRRARRLPCAPDGDPGMFAGRDPLGVAESSTLN
ncbi:hypothetical protein ACFV2H_11815 [Streptomyces sp. NPDC059629]|uniref:hypothetical protein n=1 Tax=Streptomyces sp. NPDC059629 TaxID=3346889 RepID=UPI0036BA6A78